MRNLCAGRRHELVVHRGGGLLLRIGKFVHRKFEVITHDRRRTAEPPKCLQAYDGRAAFALVVPQPLEHQLQIRRLDAVRPRVACAAAS